MMTRIGTVLQGRAPARWPRPAAVTAAVATAAVAAGLLAPAATASAAGRRTPPAAAVPAARDVTVSGEVTGNSGPRWPVYARVSRAGATAVSYTDPATGRYALPVPPHGSYTIDVTPITPGYQPVTVTVAVGATGLTRDISDPVNLTACTAPGYRFVASLSEDFDGKTKPAGWSVVTTGNPGNTWQFGQPVGANGTGGTGDYAAANQQQFQDPANTDLITPAVSLSGTADPQVQFDSYSVSSNVPPQENEAVQVSVDGGKTWTTAAAWTGTAIPGGPVSVPLPQAAGHPSVRLRFQYLDSPAPTPGGSGSSNFWQVDDVTVGQCQPVPGGLVVGRVTDANTGRAVDGATVTGGSPARSAVTVATPADPAVGGGLYWLFASPAGRHPFTVAAPGYAPAAYPVTVRDGRVTPASFRLDAGRLVLLTGPVTATARMGGRAQATVMVRNTGTAPTSVTIFQTWPSGFTLLGAPAAAPGAPLQRVTGHFDPHLVRAGRGPGVGDAEQAAHTRPTALAAPGSGGPWLPAAQYPTQVQDVAAATDPATGAVYAVGGAADSGVLSAGDVLDPGTGQWAALPPMSNARAGAQAVFLGGRLYVTGGYDNQGNPVPYSEAYDPDLRQWSTAASIPLAYYGAAAAALNGRMYVVGGCDPDTGQCGENNVQVYSPTTNTWGAAAPYPFPVAFTSCGAIAGRLYCAGGVSDFTGSTSAGYVYDPGANAWSAIPHLPIDLWGSAYSTANGELLVSGGVTAQSTVVTNQGYAFSPVTDAWTTLPNGPGAPVFRSAGACGFYRVGGINGATQNPVATVAQLPGYGGCGGPSWLSARPSRLTVAPGHSARVTVVLNAASPSVAQPGSYTATLQFSSGSPYPAPTLPVRLAATPPASWGRLAGTVAGRACNGRTAPLPGATVQVTGAHGTWILTAGRDGRYALWLDKNNGRATLIASQPGWLSQVATAPITPRATTIRNFRLAEATGCG
jgi:N-acetylneuraminic acid mutarotase